MKKNILSLWLYIKVNIFKQTVDLFEMFDEWFYIVNKQL